MKTLHHLIQCLVQCFMVAAILALPFIIYFWEMTR